MKHIVIITGASSGIGREFARQMDQGFSSIDEFWLVARRQERLEEIKRAMRHRVRILAFDLSEMDSLARFWELLNEEKPVVRMLINCAGYGMIGDFERIPVVPQTGQLDVNCRALTWLTHACLPYMQKNSRILQMASSAAFLPQPGFAVYAASKAYVLSFSRALAQELSSKKIYVTAVCPGPVSTAFFDVAEQYGKMMSVKKYTMVSAKRVVREALCASFRRKRMVICGFPMRAFYFATRVLPQGPMIFAAGQWKGRSQNEESED